jgi:hypothetical protein
MRKWMDGIREPGVPTDAGTARAMRELAEAFVSGMAEEGERFGWESTEAGRLDDICGDVLASRPPQPVRQGVTMRMGAYLGELLVRNGDGRWTYDPAQGAPAVALPNGLRGFPHHEVERRLDTGGEQYLVRFYWTAMKGETAAPQP